MKHHSLFLDSHIGADELVANLNSTPGIMVPEYSKEEIIQYYDRISIPDALRIYDVSGLSPKAALSYLRELQKHHLVSVPFENIVSLHFFVTGGIP